MVVQKMITLSYDELARVYVIQFCSTIEQDFFKSKINCRQDIMISADRYHSRMFN